MFERAAFRPISFGQPPDKYFRVARRSDPENEDSGTQVTCRESPHAELRHMLAAEASRFFGLHHSSVSGLN
jgi:hypothetical protein